MKIKRTSKFESASIDMLLRHKSEIDKHFWLRSMRRLKTGVLRNNMHRASRDAAKIKSGKYIRIGAQSVSVLRRERKEREAKIHNDILIANRIKK